MDEGTSGQLGAGFVHFGIADIDGGGQLMAGDDIPDIFGLWFLAASLAFVVGKVLLKPSKPEEAFDITILAIADQEQRVPAGKRLEHFFHTWVDDAAVGGKLIAFFLSADLKDIGRIFPDAGKQGARDFGGSHPHDALDLGKGGRFFNTKPPGKC